MAYTTRERGGGALNVEFGALADLQQYVDSMPEAATEGARIALNDVAEGPGLAIFRKAVAEEANFPPGYLNDDRLGIERRATNRDLAVTITGRFRPTSLARFATGSTAIGRRGDIRVEVKRGQTSTFSRAFFVRLKGRGNRGDNFNVGLAIRLKPGETITGTTGAVELDKGLYLLYGPSVDQIFREAGPDNAPEVLRLTEQEFYRQFFRLAGKANGRRSPR